MGYAPQAQIDHDALRHNLQRVRDTAPDSRVWSVIKADAYGHGVERVATALQESDGFAVARLDEGLKLRKAAFKQPILIMGGCYTSDEWVQAVRNEFDVVVHQERQVTLLESLPLDTGSINVWLKVETGMHRLGIPSEHLTDLADRLTAHPRVRRINLMTHLANADDRSDSFTYSQIARFESHKTDRFTHGSIANSAGVLGFQATHRDWVRPGIMLYGVSPFSDTSAEELGLRPVMTFRSRVIAVQQCRRDDPVGYGGTYNCPQDMPIAVVAVGYGDGYPRHAEEGTPVLVAGRRLPLVGRVSMDMITVDARDYPEVQAGDSVVLWGRGLPVEEVAKSAGTIGYELLCSVTSRVEFLDLNRRDTKGI
ncbi:MAG: alanine racemase [Candidatus Thiodiazotropha sp. (ex Monitilora ramsayi)]|nr:alanine racemase [Candidatus Thiodiazotropha sp. (ex Monitilora ramsayi)]